MLQAPLLMAVKKNLPKMSGNFYAETMTVIFLDSATVDLGDVDLKPLQRSGLDRTYPETFPSQIALRIRKAEVVITNKCVLGELEMAAAPDLKLICVAATGVNNIDLDAARRRKIAVTNIPGYSTTSVAEHTVLFLLALSHRLREHDQSARTRWSGAKSFALLDHPYSNLSEKTLGIIGYGHIGRRVARLAKALGMKVLIARLPGRSYSDHPRRRSLKELLSVSDYVTLHCPLNSATHHLINKRHLAAMKPGASLLNLARGPIVDEKAVAKVLRKGKLAYYATDVLSHEPPSIRHPLFSKGLKDKVLMTPHVAWASRESRQRLIQEMALNIRAFHSGRQRNRVDIFL